MFNRFPARSCIAFALFCFLGLPHQTRAQTYPSRPVTIIVAQPPGGGTDIIARIIANQLSQQLSQPFVVENRPGAGTVVGTATAANAAPDGYTLITGLNANMAVNPSLFAHLSYDPIRDFTPVSMLAEFPFAIVVSNNFPAHLIGDLIAMAKAKPGVINFASAGNGTGQHLSTELFELEAGIKMTHVPYRGAAPAYTDVMSGQTPVFFDNLASALGQIKGNSVRALAVTGRDDAAPRHCAYRHSASLRWEDVANGFRGLAWHSSGAQAPRERISISSLPDLIRQSMRRVRLLNRTVCGASAWTTGPSPAEGLLSTAEKVIRFGPQAGQARW
jgi:tripartite-type tricarboxylate transporter receptor subunit TctC